MLEFVTVDQAKAQIYQIGSEDDPYIQGLVWAASAAVQNYLKSAVPFQPVLDSNNQPEVDSSGDTVYEIDSSGDRIIRMEVQQATLLMVGYMYRNRDENPNNEFQQGYLPAPVTALLYPLRTPALV